MCDALRRDLGDGTGGEERRARFDAACAEKGVALLDVDGQGHGDEVGDDQLQGACRSRRLDFARDVVAVGPAVCPRLIIDCRRRGLWVRCRVGVESDMMSVPTGVGIAGADAGGART